jgi:hypothetical protein
MIGYKIEISKASREDDTCPDGSGWMICAECEGDLGIIWDEDAARERLAEMEAQEIKGTFVFRIVKVTS